MRACGAPRFSPSCVLGRGPARLCLHPLWFPRTFPGEAVPWDASTHTSLSGMSPRQLFGGHRAWVTSRDTQRGQAGTAQPAVWLWLQDCAGLSRTKQLGQEGCRLRSQQYPWAWDAAIQWSPWTISSAGAAGNVQLARGIFIRFSHSVATLHQFFVLVLGIQTPQTSAQSLCEVLPLCRMVRLSRYSCT